jgi:hypothetical protein
VYLSIPSLHVLCCSHVLVRTNTAILISQNAHVWPLQWLERRPGCPGRCPDSGRHACEAAVTMFAATKGITVATGYHPGSRLSNEAAPRPGWAMILRPPYHGVAPWGTAPRRKAHWPKAVCHLRKGASATCDLALQQGSLVIRSKAGTAIGSITAGRQARFGTLARLRRTYDPRGEGLGPFATSADSGRRQNCSAQLWDPRPQLRRGFLRHTWHRHLTSTKH